MKRVFAVLLASLPLLAHAHVGSHAHDEFSLLQALAHLLTDPAHLAILVVAIIAGVIGAQVYRRQRSDKRNR